MNTDTKKTAVIFYMEPEPEGNRIGAYTPQPDPEPFAYFPDEIWDNAGNRTCYQHTGQHSACHPAYIKNLKLATPEQYRPLEKELKSIGYNLKILNP